MDYVTIASTGNAQDFGDLTVARLYDPAGAATSTRGVFAGGQNQNVIDYITIASTGNATDFGDLRGVASQKIGGHCSDEAAVQNEAGFPPSAMGLFAGGYTNLASGGSQSTVEYIDIATTGNSIIFGDLIEKSESFDGVASSTRAVFGAHYLRSGNSKSNIIEHLTFSTKGKATDFGDSSQLRVAYSALSNSTRGIFSGGDTNFSGGTSLVNTMDYITIASAGNATDFGDRTESNYYNASSANTTTGITSGGINSSTRTNVIDYVTIASTGDSTDFGDLSGTRGYLGAASSNTRMVVGGGMDGAGNNVNIIEYLTIASTSNATDFGDLTATRAGLKALSSSTRAVFNSGDSTSMVMDYVTIASTGNAQDFGDTTCQGNFGGKASNSHGGIS